MKAAILFLSYNRREYTMEALDFLLRNTPVEHDILCYDNGSTDGTAEWVANRAEDERDAGRRVFFIGAKQNKGIAKAMNVFFDIYPHVDWYGKVDNDTVVPEGWLDKLIYAAEAANMDALQALHHVMAKPGQTWEDVKKANKHEKIKVKNHYLRPDLLRSRSFPDASISSNLSPPVIQVDEIGTVHNFGWCGGSGLVIRQSYIGENRLREDVQPMAGWVYYRHIHPGRLGIYDGVFVRLLDMEDHGKYKAREDYPEYRDEINRLRGWKTQPT